MAQTLDIQAFSDREILHLVQDHMGPDGWAHTPEMVASMGLSPNGMDKAAFDRYMRRCLGIRLSWIRRLTGCVERNMQHPQQWRLTPDGELVVRAQLSAGIASGLERMGDAAALVALQRLSARYKATGATSANLMRREWQHGTGRRA